MAVLLDKSWEHPSPSVGTSTKRKSKYNIEMSAMKKRRPNAKSYTVDIYEQPRSKGVSFLNQHQMPSSSTYIVGERSKAQVQTDPSLLLSNFRGTVKLVWYLVEDDVRCLHPYILEGDDCVEGVCTKTIKAKGEVISFPGLSIRKVSRKEMDKVLSKRVDRLKQLVPEMGFRMKSLGDYNLRSVKICFQALPQDADHDYAIILKPVMTRKISSTDPFPLSDPRIMSISECKGTVHGKTEVTLQVSNLKTDDVLVFFYCESSEPRSSWQEFADVLNFRWTKHRQASILIQTPPFPDRIITEPKTVNVKIRLRDNSCSNTVNYTYTPPIQGGNRIQRRVKQKEPIFVNYYSCLGAVTNVSPLVPTRELHQDEKKSTSDVDEYPRIAGIDIKPKRQTLKTPTKREDKDPRKSSSLSVPAGQSVQARTLERLNSKEEVEEADGRVDLDHLSRYLSLTNLNVPKESAPNGIPSHEFHREELEGEGQLSMEASGASSCRTITEENVIENSPLLLEEGFYSQGLGFCKGGNVTEVPHPISPSSLGRFSEQEDDFAKEPSLPESDFLLHSNSSHLSTVCDQREEACPVWEPNTDSGFAVTRSPISAVVVPPCISEQSDFRICRESTPLDGLEKKRCMFHAGEDKTSMSTSPTTSPEALHSTDDQQGAEGNQNFGSSQHENESASEGGNREGDGHDHKGNDEAEDQTFTEELRPPRATQRIDHRGGTISLNKCDVSLTIPAGALAEGREEEIVLSVDWNDRHIPPLNGTDMNVAPIVNCYPTGLTFLKPVTIKIPHCAILPDPGKVKATVHCSETDEEKEPDWERLSQDGTSEVQVECGSRYFRLHTRHFTSFSITVNKVETMGKEIMFVPFGKDLNSFEDDQVIRLYQYDFYASNWERILQQEKNFEGKQLDTPVPYQVLELYQGTVAVEMFYNTPGWVLDSDKTVSILFHTIWNIRSWNRCKFTWTNKTENMKFSCKIKVNQSQNDVVLSLDIANHVKLSPKSTEQSSYPRQFSSMQPAPSGPHQGVTVYNNIHGNYFQDSRSCDSGFTLSRMQSVCDMPEPIISIHLQCQLHMLLDPNHVFGNDWRKLAELNGYGQCIQYWKSEQECKESFSPTRHILKLMEQDNKINSLDDLEELMEQLERNDAVQAVAKVRQQRGQPNPSSTTLPALTGGLAEQPEKPMSTETTPSPTDINQPLCDGVQSCYDFQLHSDRDVTSQSERCKPPTASSDQETTASNSPYTDYTHDSDHTPSNNNQWSSATRKELDFKDPVKEIQEEFENKIAL
ncbi:uncharacterized protein LOC117288773 isoform X1 [Asterias rubens]|uniref:uncharacterized protein LOC117288773 isoform X1 n=2 Tax=Asterias rubens TaxID=7604 RepID=UPI0014551A66|nr:uncharacterized protein LOC117288773 isoform X1 [Asterias rubens]XP_033625511.1 uncharacterized protein LOC117288773 isoform X1 [Asterias rubens]